MSKIPNVYYGKFADEGVSQTTQICVFMINVWNFLGKHLDRIKILVEKGF